MKLREATILDASIHLAAAFEGMIYAASRSEREGLSPSRLYDARQKLTRALENYARAMNGFGLRDP